MQETRGAVQLQVTVMLKYFFSKYIFSIIYIVRGVRVSKFRHVYGVPAKKEKCYEGARITRRCYFALLILLITE